MTAIVPGPHPPFEPPRDVVGRSVAPSPHGSAAELLLVARIAEQEHLAGRVGDSPVTGPRRQAMTVREAADEVDRIKAVIALDEQGFTDRHSSLRHRLAPRWTKVLTLLILIFVDHPIMLYMAASIFDVDWSDPLGIRLLISIVVAVLATGGAAAALHHLGHEHREHKNDDGQLAWRTLPTASRVTLFAVAVLLALIGVSSYWRIYTEGVLSGSDLAVLLALLVALVLVVSAWLAYRTAFKDGSVLTDDLRDLSALVNLHAAIRRTHEDRAAAFRHQLVMLQRHAANGDD